MLKQVAAALAITGALLTGCKTGPDYVPPERSVPPQWSSPLGDHETDNPVSVADWWTTLDDPKLNDLIGRSLQSNLDLRTAEARVREARAARGIVASALWPALAASGSYAHAQSARQQIPSGSPVSVGLSRGPTGTSAGVTVRGDNATVTHTIGTGAGGTGPVSSTSASFTPGGVQRTPSRTADLFQVGFDANWELDVFGGTRRAVEAANADIGAAIEGRRDVLVSLVSELALNYIGLRTAQNRLRITRENIDAQAGTVRLTRARYEAGLNSELDTVRAESLLATTQSQVPLLETQIAEFVHRMSILLGQEPGALADELLPPAPLPSAPAEVPVGLPSDLLRRRPDIRRAERELAAATARIGQATADLFPRFSLTGTFVGRGNLFGTVLSGANQAWSIGPGIDWPFFQGGRIRANIEVQNARQEQAAIGYEQTILTALGDVENGLVSFANEQARRQYLETAVQADERAVRLANERYIRGLEDFLTVLQAQQQLFQSEDQLVQSHSLVLTDLISLYKALGGGWEVAEPASAPPSATEQ